MKWNEKAFVRKIISGVGYVCAVVVLILCILEACDIQPIPKAVTCALVSVFFLCAGLKADNRKKKILGYVLSAGWFVLSVMYCF